LTERAEERIKLYKGVIRHDKGNKRSSASTFATATALKEKFTLELVMSDLKAFDLAELDSQMFGGGSDPFMYDHLMQTILR